MAKPKLAIIGSGVAGLSAAYFLHQTFEITVFEKNSYIGGHTNTITLEPHGQKTQPIPIDTGFMVFNRVTYPNFVRFLDQIKVAYVPTEMSFSVQYPSLNLEWNGAGLNKIFSQRRNLTNLRFWAMLLQLNRFNKDAKSLFQRLSNGQACLELNLTVAEYVQRQGYGQDFLALFLLPMSSAIWSTAPEKMLNFPIRTLILFFNNHGFLGLADHHQWFTIKNGSKSYVEYLKNALPLHWVVNHPIRNVFQEGERVVVTSEGAPDQTFDRAVLACHADESLAILGSSASALETELLSPFRYEQNSALLHTDTRVMPKRPLCWASWNYRLDHDTTDTSLSPKASTHYWMSHLQHITQSDQQYFVSINAEHLVNPECVLRQIDYTHPVFNPGALKAQAQLPALNQQKNRRIGFCGSYFRYGFHEDAFTSGLDLAESIMGGPAW